VKRVQVSKSESPSFALEKLEFSASRDGVALAAGLFSRAYNRSRGVREAKGLIGKESALLATVRPAWLVAASASLREGDGTFRQVLLAHHGTQEASKSGESDSRRADYLTPAELNLEDSARLETRLGVPLQYLLPQPSEGARAAGVRSVGYLQFFLKYHPQSENK
jgi:hypothetical protein